MLFLTLFFVSALVTNAVRACEDGYFIKEKSDNGEIIILNDESVWRVAPYDTITSSLWLNISSIIACDDKLINTDDNEIVEAKRLR